jgi:hypothetical protein
MLLVGIVHHLVPHMDAMRGNSHCIYAKSNYKVVSLCIWLHMAVTAPSGSQQPVVGGCYGHVSPSVYGHT